MKKMYIRFILSFALLIALASFASAQVCWSTNMSASTQSAGASATYTFTSNVSYPTENITLNFSNFGPNPGDYNLSQVAWPADFSFNGFNVNPTGATIDDASKTITLTGSNASAEVIFQVTVSNVINPQKGRYNNVILKVEPWINCINPSLIFGHSLANGDFEMAGMTEPWLLNTFSLDNSFTGQASSQYHVIGSAFTGYNLTINGNTQNFSTVGVWSREIMDVSAYNGQPIVNITFLSGPATLTQIIDMSSYAVPTKLIWWQKYSGTLALDSIGLFKLLSGAVFNGDFQTPDNFIGNCEFNSTESNGTGGSLRCGISTGWFNIYANDVDVTQGKGLTPGGAWETRFIDLGNFSNQDVELRFVMDNPGKMMTYIRPTPASSCLYFDVKYGDYFDNIALAQCPPPKLDFFNKGFESGLVDWTTAGGISIDNARFTEGAQSALIPFSSTVNPVINDAQDTTQPITTQPPWGTRSFIINKSLYADQTITVGVAINYPTYYVKQPVYINGSSIQDPMVFFDIMVNGTETLVDDFSILYVDMTNVSGTIKDSSGNPIISDGTMGVNMCSISMGCFGTSVPNGLSSFSLKVPQAADYNFNVMNPGYANIGVDNGVDPITISGSNFEINATLLALNMTYTRNPSNGPYTTGQTLMFDITINNSDTLSITDLTLGAMMYPYTGPGYYGVPFWGKSIDVNISSGSQSTYQIKMPIAFSAISGSYLFEPDLFKTYAALETSSGPHNANILIKPQSPVQQTVNAAILNENFFVNIDNVEAEDPAGDTIDSLAPLDILYFNSGSIGDLRYKFILNNLENTTACQNPFPAGTKEYVWGFALDAKSGFGDPSKGYADYSIVLFIDNMTKEYDFEYWDGASWEPNESVIVDTNYFCTGNEVKFKLNSSDIANDTQIKVVGAFTSRIDDSFTETVEDFVDFIPPLANLTGAATANVGMDYLLDASASIDNIGIAMYYWDFTNDSIIDYNDTLSTTNTTYNLLGNVTAALIVQDSSGRNSTAYWTLEVIDTIAPQINNITWSNIQTGSATGSIFINATDNFNISSLNITVDGVEYVTSFVAGLYEALSIAAAANASTVSIDVIVFDSDSNNDTMNVIAPVIDNIAPTMGMSITYFANVSMPFSLTANVSDNIGVTAYEWNFTGVILQTLSVFSNTFSTVGAVPGTLSVWDAAGKNISQAITINVTDQVAPTASAIVSPLVVDENFPIFYDASSSFDNYYPNSNLSFFWDFGTGTTTNESGSHTYSAPGIYTVKLNVSDLSGNVGTDSINVTVLNGTLPNVSITAPFGAISGGYSLTADVLSATSAYFVIPALGATQYPFNLSTGTELLSMIAVPGTYDIYLYADNMNGQSYDITTVTYYTSLTPTIEVLYPANGATVSENLTIELLMDPITAPLTADYAIDGAWTPLVGSYYYSIPITGWSEGLHNFTFNITNDLSLTASVPYVININNTFGALQAAALALVWGLRTQAQDNYNLMIAGTNLTSDEQSAMTDANVTNEVLAAIAQFDSIYSIISGLTNPSDAPLIQEYITNLTAIKETTVGEINILSEETEIISGNDPATFASTLSDIDALSSVNYTAAELSNMTLLSNITTTIKVVEMVYMSGDSANVTSIDKNITLPSGTQLFPSMSYFGNTNDGNSNTIVTPDGAIVIEIPKTAISGIAALDLCTGAATSCNSTGINTTAVLFGSISGYFFEVLLADPVVKWSFSTAPAAPASPSGGGGGGGGGGSTGACGVWSECSINNIMTQVCNDATGKPQTINTKPCEYVPTCTDGFKNGKETGPDCGGDCSACKGNEKEKKVEESQGKVRRDPITGAVIGIGADEISSSFFSDPLKIGGIAVILVASVLGYLVFSRPKKPSAGNSGGQGPVSPNQ